jgi:ABC-type bacteriocin/lantibiotic exporter with double-glycine peptidase domain
LKASGCEHRASQHWAASYVDVMNVGLKRGAYGSWTDAVFATVRMTSPFVLLVVGILLVLRGDFTLGTMLSALSFAHGFIGPLGNLIATFSSLQMVGVHLGRIDDVLITTPEQDRSNLRVLNNLKGKIEVEHVSFRYASNAPYVLDDISLSIPAGATVALVGRSGCGKSTLASLLLGLYTPTSGHIVYDDYKLSDLDLRTVRRQVGVVVQQPHIFSTSVRANIALADPAIPLARVEEAAKRACIHDDIMRLPMGYDTPLVAGGGSISGGQRQRIALARALVGNPSILLLDEATSALDTVTEGRVQHELAGLGCTRILIAHRMSTVFGADLIVVLDKGTIVARGKHHELLAQCSLYRELAAGQEEPPRGDRRGETVRLAGPQLHDPSKDTIVDLQVRRLALAQAREDERIQKRGRA